MSTACEHYMNMCLYTCIYTCVCACVVCICVSACVSVSVNVCVCVCVWYVCTVDFWNTGIVYKGTQTPGQTAYQSCLTHPHTNTDRPGGQTGMKCTDETSPLLTRVIDRLIKTDGGRGKQNIA